mmetsp:Transcript_7803/g.22784  ORF Transcript_7803/g.22784 Transcript_7803/m.22784 type:complete len:222 (+) Transcript_7803:2882-3547(+)
MSVLRMMTRAALPSGKFDIGRGVQLRHARSHVDSNPLYLRLLFHLRRERLHNRRGARQFARPGRFLGRSSVRMVLGEGRGREARGHVVHGGARALAISDDARCTMTPIKEAPPRGNGVHDSRRTAGRGAVAWHRVQPFDSISALAGLRGFFRLADAAGWPTAQSAELAHRMRALISQLLIARAPPRPGIVTLRSQRSCRPRSPIGPHPRSVRPRGHARQRG